MNYNWKQWEGQAVDGRFPLHQYLGASEHDAVYLTERVGTTPGRAAIKVIPEELTNPERQLSAWRRSMKLSHPNLLRVFDCGVAKLDSTSIVYVVMEYADEDLSQILPDRPLSPAECGAMLQPIMEALSYVHGSGLVHGQMRPANVVAVGNTVKLASDTVQTAGPLLVKGPEFPTPYDAPEIAQTGVSVPSDVWALGATMMEALTQDPPIVDLSNPQDPAVLALPEPFSTAIANCLRVDPTSRWPLERVQAVLAAAPKAEPVAATNAAALPPPPPMAAQPAAAEHLATSNRPKSHLAIAALVGLVLLALVAYFATHGHESNPKPDSSPVNAPVSAPVATETANSGESATPPQSAPAKLASGSGDVIHRDIPNVSPGALHTIHGTIRVSVRVSVDAEGNVTATALEKHGPSAYFARIARESARQWKFAAPQVDGRSAASDWLLEYQFRRDGTNVTSRLENP